MISLFDLSFPRVVIERDLGMGTEGLLMGVSVNGPAVQGLVILEDGGMSLVDMARLTMAYKYDAENDRWYDTSVPKPEQEERIDDHLPEKG